MNPTIYLDYAATAPVCEAAAKAAYEAMTIGFGNPSSGYPLGKRAAQKRDEDRAIIARVLGCQPDELFFTSGGTEGDNWAIRAALHINRRAGRHIVTTTIEHAAVLESIRALERNEGYEVTWLRPDRTGHIDPQSVEDAICPDTALVTMMLVNNELGTLLPVQAASQAIRTKGSAALLHTDAVQAFLKMPFTSGELGADFITICGHKIGAPKGIGALYIKRNLIPNVPPLLLGGGQENGLRPGTEATAQIAAFAAAVEIWTPDLPEHIRAVKDYAAQKLSAINEVKVIAAGDAPHILAVSLPLFSGQTIVEALAGQGVCVSSGSACHRGKPSHVFAALPLPPKTQYGAIRISFGPGSTTSEVDRLCKLVEHMCKNKTLLFQ